MQALLASYSKLLIVSSVSGFDIHSLHITPLIFPTNLE
jgi:hypothetical protein